MIRRLALLILVLAAITHQNPLSGRNEEASDLKLVPLELAKQRDEFAKTLYDLRKPNDVEENFWNDLKENENLQEPDENQPDDSYLIHLEIDEPNEQEDQKDDEDTEESNLEQAENQKQEYFYDKDYISSEKEDEKPDDTYIIHFEIDPEIDESNQEYSLDNEQDNIDEAQEQLILIDSDLESFLSNEIDSKVDIKESWRWSPYIVDQQAQQDMEFIKRKVTRIESLVISTLQLIIVLSLFLLVCHILIMATSAAYRVKFFYFKPKATNHCKTDCSKRPLLDI